jgi:hypothetical protein
MVITYKQFKKLDFPIFLLDSSNWEIADGLLLLDGKLLDDKNMPGDSLGLRRMLTPHKEQYHLRNMITTANGLMKQKTKYFIDNGGNPFIYEKTEFAQLKYLKIKKVEPKIKACLLWVHGCSFPFTIPRPPETGFMWAGILHIKNNPWLLYEYAEEKLKDTRRKI